MAMSQIPGSLPIVPPTAIHRLSGDQASSPTPAYSNTPADVNGTTEAIRRTVPPSAGMTITSAHRLIGPHLQEGQAAAVR